MIRIDNNESISKESHYEFLELIEISLLLALKERGSLDLIQYKHAEEILRSKQRNRINDVLSKRENGND
jgi:hypothetical protein